MNGMLGPSYLSSHGFDTEDGVTRDAKVRGIESR